MPGPGWSLQGTTLLLDRIRRPPSSRNTPLVTPRSLMRLALFSAGLHQLVVTIASAMPFAVAILQDVGVLVLAHMASRIASAAPGGTDDKRIVPTTLLTLSAATIVVGTFLLAAAKTRAMTVCQYIPLPIVGGYLAYLGLFFIKSGLALAAGIHLEQWRDVAQVRPMHLVKAAPALGAMLVLLLGVRRFKHPLVLPALLTCMPLVFYLVWCLALGKSLEDGRQQGWIIPSVGEVDMPHGLVGVWHLFDFSCKCGGGNGGGCSVGAAEVEGLAGFGRVAGAGELARIAGVHRTAVLGKC